MHRGRRPSPWHVAALVPLLLLLACGVAASPAAPGSAPGGGPCGGSCTPPGASPAAPSPTPGGGAGPGARCHAVRADGTPVCPPEATAPVAPSAATPAGLGYLEGHAAIGPLQPVERAGQPSPTPAPAVCTARGLAIYGADGATEVARFALQPDCTYRVALPPGRYVVRLAGPAPGVGGGRNLPATVTIASGQTTRLDLDIDTGIR